MGFAIAGGIALSGLAGAYGANQAAGAETSAANAAAGLSESEFNTINNQEAPYRAAGVGALNTINAEMPELNSPFTMDKFHQDPGYQFQLQQGENAIQESAAAHGVLNSTATMKNLSGYAEGLANTDYQNAFNNYQTQNNATYNRLAGVAGIGQTSNQTTAQSGTAMAANAGQNIVGAGNATAAGYMGAANAVQNGVGQGMNTWMMSQIMNRSPGGLPPGTSSPY